MSKAIVSFFVLLSLGVHSGVAVPYHTITLDGRPTEYTETELAGSNDLGAGEFGVFNIITNLYVTWDADYLYVMLQGWSADNDKLIVLLDADPGVGSGATTTTNWINNEVPYISFNSMGWQAADASGVAFGADYMLAHTPPFNNLLHINYDGVEEPTTNNVIALFDQDNGNQPRGTPVDIATQHDDTECYLKGMEARIPWSVLFAGDQYGVVEVDEVIPRNAQIRLFAGLHNNQSAEAYSDNRSIPNQDPSNWDAGLLTTDTYITIDIDLDGDGIPDNLRGATENPPFLRDVMGKEAGTIVYARFDKAVDANSATNPANWDIAGLDIDEILQPEADTVYIYLNEPIPSGLLEVRATGVAGADGSDGRETYLCLFPAADGLDAPLTVRFVLETNSGMGIQSGTGIATSLAHRATAYFINGNSPLEWGYPPSMNAPITNLVSGTLRYRDVILPPGTPLSYTYKFSALLPTGTNNYEAISLIDYLNTDRVLTLDPDAPGGVMYVTNRLGAAAAPLRGSEVEDAYRNLYRDTRRGDAGVGTRKELTFQLDLSAYADRSGIQRVMIQGSDPLRGFNSDGIKTDWLGGTPIPNNLDIAGLEMTDDGSGLYTLDWTMTVDGIDNTLGGLDPHSLVGGDGFFDETPLFDWVSRRTPRYFRYQYYVVNEWGNVLNSPGSDFAVYIEPGGPTNIVFDAHIWTGPDPTTLLDEDEAPDPTAPAQVNAISMNGANLLVAYENDPQQFLHVVDFSEDLTTGFNYYGDLLPLGASGMATVALHSTESHLFARVRAHRRPRYEGIKWSPNPAPVDGGTVRVFFNQTRQEPLQGDRGVHIIGSFTGWGNPQPMTFVGDGLWIYDVDVPPSSPTLQFKLRDRNLTQWIAPWGIGPDGNLPIYVGQHPNAWWEPENPEPGESVTIYYDPVGGPLAAAAQVFAHSGFDEGWSETQGRPMTWNAGQELWILNLPIPTNYNTSVNFVFNNGSGIWHSENDGGGRAWRAFLGPLPNLD